MFINKCVFTFMSIFSRFYFWHFWILIIVANLQTALMKCTHFVTVHIQPVTGQLQLLSLKSTTLARRYQLRYTLAVLLSH